MKINSYYISLVIMVIVQILICNYVNLSPIVTISILPVVILCLPIKTGSISAMALAFISGLAVDLLADGILGLNALALVPVAFLRREVLTSIFGSGIFAMKENLSYHKHGIGRIAIALVFVQALFLIIYIIADGAGTRPLAFNLVRFTASLITGSLLSMALVFILTNDDRN